MISPFTDFDKWISNATLALNNPVKFEAYYPTFEVLLSHIAQYGFLPEPLQRRTDFFIDKIQVQLCKKIISNEEKEDAKLPILRQYLDLFLRFSLYGIKSNDKYALNLAITILQSGEMPFYQTKSGRSIYKSLCRKYVEYKALKMILDRISDSIQDLELYRMLLILVSVLRSHDSEFKPMLFLQTVFKSINSFVLANQASLKVDCLGNCIEEIRNSLPNKCDITVFFISSILPLLTMFFSSENFEQRLAALREVAKLASDQVFHKQIATFFDKKNKLIENIVFREEYASHIGKIISLLAKYDACTNYLVNKLWEKRAHLHASDLSSFYQMFLRFAEFGKDKVLDDTISSVFSLPHKVEWFDLLDSLSAILKERKDASPYLDSIRDFLMQIVFDKNENENPSDIFGRAKSSLLLMVTYGATENTFIHLCEFLTSSDDKFILNLLNKFLHQDAKIKIQQETILHALNKAIDLLVLHTQNELQEIAPTPGPSEEIKSYILNLCKFNKNSLTVEQLEKIFSCYTIKESYEFEINSNEEINVMRMQHNETNSEYSTFPAFFTFLDSLVNEQSITADHLELLLDRFTSSDRSFFKLVKHLIYAANDCNPLAATVTHLPLVKEDLLWNFALTDSPRRLEFDKMLCQVYASNDGEELTDKEVIDAFLTKWQMYFDHLMNKPADKNINEGTIESVVNQLIDENDPNISSFISGDNQENQKNSIDLNIPTTPSILIDILRLFVFIMESQSAQDFNYAHRYESEEVIVQIYWIDQPNSMRLLASPSTTIGAIIAKISEEKNIKISTPSLTLHNDISKPLKRGQTVGIFAEKQNNGKMEALFDIKYGTGRRIKLHKRTARASNEIIHSEYINQIFEKLLYEQNDISAYELFKLLPKYPKSPEFKSAGNIDLKSIFPCDHICYFLYNMITLLIESKEDLNIANHLIINNQIDDYFIDAIETLILCKDFNELNQFDTEFMQYFLDFFLLIDPIKDKVATSYRLFEVMLKLSMNPSIFNKVKLVCDRQFKEKNLQYKIPDNFENIFRYLIFHDDEKYREFALKQFENINIPASLFIDCLNDYGSLVSDEFLTSLTTHLSEELINESHLGQLVLNLLFSDSSHGDFLLNILTLVYNMLERGILDKSQHSQLLDFLLNKFLTFDYDKKDRVAFVTASKCIVLLSSNDKKKLIEILKTINASQNHPSYEYQINGDQVSISNFNKVGLKNLGMTCYLNATLQQFYSVKPFRYAIMSYTGNEAFLKQLAHLFQYMKFYQTKSVTTEGFIENFWFMGEKLNPRVQQDAAEFIQFFFDLFQLDHTYKSIVDDLFQVITLNSKHDTNKTYEQFEHSYVFELDVKHLNSMVDSFEHFLQPNYITDNHQSNEVVNYSKLSRIPPFLIIQLKRFEYSPELRQRQKISRHFNISTTINIAKYTNNPEEEAIYVLTGVIIHRGVATGGHYISYAKSKKNGWLCFGDDIVTSISEDEMMRNATGIENSNIAGYILFYKRQNIDSGLPWMNYQKDFVLPEETRRTIDRLNEENIQHQLVYSAGYFELMKGLSKLVNDDFVEICLKYAVNTLPFAKKASDSKEIYANLSKKLKSNPSLSNTFISYVLENSFLRSALFECPIEQVRKGICKLIKAAFDPKNDDKSEEFNNCLMTFSEEVFKIVPNCLLNYRNIDELFKVLTFLVKKYPQVKNLAETEWNDSIRNLFIDGLAEFMKQNPSLLQSYFFKGINLTHYIKFVCNLNLQREEHETIFDEAFYQNVIVSSSSPQSLALFTLKYYSTDTFTELLHKQDLAIDDPYKLMALIFHVIPETAIFSALSLEFKKVSYPCRSNDIITLIAAVVCEYPETVTDIVVNHCNEWMPLFLADNHNATRNNAVVCALYTVPSETITKRSFLDLDLPDYLYLPAEMEPKLKPIDEPMKRRSRILLQCLFNVVAVHLTNIVTYNSKGPKTKLTIQNPNLSNNTSSATTSSAPPDLQVENRASQFYQLINELCLMTPVVQWNPQFPMKEYAIIQGSVIIVNWASIIGLYRVICNNDKELFTDQITAALMVFNNHNIPLNYDDLMLSVGINANELASKGRIKEKKKNYTNLHNFLPHFLSILKRFPNVTIDFVIFFMDNIAFAPISKVAKCYNEVKSLVLDLVPNYSTLIFDMLASKKGKKWEKNNMPMIVTLCNATHRLRIIFPQLADTFKEIVKAKCVDVNELILMAIDRSAKHSYSNQCIEKIMESDELSAKVKKVLRSLLE